MDKVHISIVICTYNRAEMLRIALNSLLSQKTSDKFTYNILVIDDASTDRTRKVVHDIKKSAKVPIKYISEGGNGIAQARNRGISESFGEWVAFTDDDQLAEPNWLEELFILACKKKVCCVGGRRKLISNKKKLDHISSICRSILGEIDYGTEPISCRRKTYPCTGNALIKKECFYIVGRFDASLKWGGSDIDFFNRLRLYGYEAWYAPNAIVHHLTPEYRLGKKYLKWKSLINGQNFANMDCKEFGFAKTAFSCIARICQAFLINAPLLLLNCLLRKQSEVLGRKCLLWRAVGYTRETLHIISPKLFSQEAFFSRVKFRKERKLFSPKGSLRINLKEDK